MINQEKDIDYLRFLFISVTQEYQKLVEWLHTDMQLVFYLPYFKYSGVTNL